MRTMRFGAFGGRPRKVSGTSWRKDISPHTAEQPRKVFGRVLRKGLLCHQGMLTMVRHDHPWLTMVSHGYGYHGYTPWSTMLHHGYPKYPGCVWGAGSGYEWHRRIALFMTICYGGNGGRTAALKMSASDRSGFWFLGWPRWQKASRNVCGRIG